MAELGEALERQAEASYRAVDYRGALDVYEEAYRAHREDTTGWAPAG